MPKAGIPTFLQKAKKVPFITALKWPVFTPAYDWFIRTVLPERKLREKVIEICAPKPGETILDFGCGTAKLTLLLKSSETKANIIGLDIDPAILRMAHFNQRAAGIPIELVEYDGGRLPFQEGTFDKIISCLVFHHLSNADKNGALSELYRVLKPGGIIYIGDWGRAANPFMWCCYFAVRLVDGFATTASNVRGDIPLLIQVAGFTAVAEKGSCNTVMGTLRYHSAIK